MASKPDDKQLKKLRCIQRSADRHWVGDGFPVRTLFAYSNLGSVLTPFLLFDYAGPREFPPTTERRGVGEHPHRGFETVRRADRRAHRRIRTVRDEYARGDPPGDGRLREREDGASEMTRRASVAIWACVGVAIRRTGSRLARRG